MTFREILEGKQVGIIYHFTKPNSILMLLNKQNQAKYGLEILEFFSHSGNFSATRNSAMSSDFSHPILSIKNDYIIRIALDGDKLSDKFKIKPVLGLQDNSFDIFRNGERVPRKWGENEEALIGNKKLMDNSTFKLKNYIKQIDIFNKHDIDIVKLKEQIEFFLNQSNINIPVNIVKHFVPLEKTKKINIFENTLNLYDCNYFQISKEK